jgi:hypothetical protein
VIRTWWNSRNRTSEPAQPDTPQCGGDARGATTIEPASPQFGATAEPAPHGEFESPQCAAEEALQRLERAWAESEPSQCGNQWESPEALARDFLGCLQAQPALVGWGVKSDWVRGVYPLFCSSARLSRPPPYKDFARELGRLTGRRRKEHWERGKRQGTFTLYAIPENRW